MYINFYLILRYIGNYWLTVLIHIGKAVVMIS